MLHLIFKTVVYNITGAGQYTYPKDSFANLFNLTFRPDALASLPSNCSEQQKLQVEQQELGKLAKKWHRFWSGNVDTYFALQKYDAVVERLDSKFRKELVERVTWEGKTVLLEFLMMQRYRG